MRVRYGDVVVEAELIMSSAERVHYNIYIYGGWWVDALFALAVFVNNRRPGDKVLVLESVRVGLSTLSPRFVLLFLRGIRRFADFDYSVWLNEEDGRIHVF